MSVVQSRLFHLSRKKFVRNYNMVIKICHNLFPPLTDVIVRDNLVFFQVVKNFSDFKQSGVKIKAITKKPIHQSFCRANLIQFTYTTC